MDSKFTAENARLVSRLGEVEARQQGIWKTLQTDTSSIALAEALWKANEELAQAKVELYRHSQGDGA